MEEFLELLRIESKIFELEFLRSSIQGKGTPQEVSDFREHALHSFLEKYFPSPNKITKGGIYDSYGKRSMSVDCVILNPCHPNTVNTQGKYGLIVADGVDVAIEVKPDISQQKYLKEALNQGLSVKKLRKIDSPIVLHHNEPDYIIEHTKKIPFFVFCTKAKRDIEKTFNEIINYYSHNQISKVNQIDVVVILNRGLLVNNKYKEEFKWGQNGFTEQQKEGWIFEEWGEDTMAGFIYYLNMVYKAAPSIHTNILPKYIASISKQIPLKALS